MGRYDVALGLSAAALNAAIRALDEKPEAHEKFFKGTVHGDVAGHEITVDWEIGKPPTVDLAAPSREAWAESVGPDGKPVSGDVPAGHLFRLHLPEANLAGEHSSQITGLTLYAEIGMCAQANALFIAPLALNETKSNLEGFDKILFNALVTPAIFRALGQAAREIDLPPLERTIFGRQFTFQKPILTIAKGYVILATSEAGGSLSLDGAVWPEGKPAFLLARPAFAISVAKPKLDEEAARLHTQGSGKTNGMKYRYSAAVTGIPSIYAADDDPLTMTAELNLAFSADVSMGGGICSASAAAENL